jgi:general secretion pathway protein D
MLRRFPIRLKPAILIALTAGLTACGFPQGESGLSPLPEIPGLTRIANTPDAAAASSGDQRQIQHVLDLRKHSSGPEDNELQKAQTEAASDFLAAGTALVKQERYREAIEKFELGLVAQPTNTELRLARQTAIGRQEAAKLFLEGQRAKAVGNYDIAESLLRRAAALSGNDTGLREELVKIEQAKKSEDRRMVLAAFKSRSPVAINFRDAKLKDALKITCEPYNLNFVFDKDTDNTIVSVSAKNVTFEQAFNMILRSSNTSYKVLGQNSVFIYEDTPDKKKQYADRYFKTFHLSTLKAERMAEILKSAMDIQTLVANNDLGTIEVRDTRDTLDVIEKLIAANDRKPAEIMLEVEIIEVDRNKADKLGLNYGSEITAELPQISFNQLLTGTNFAAQSAVTFPTVTLSYLKSNVDARTLSNPRVRTVDGQAAKIHVGDRVPLQSASIQDATGQSRTMFEYHDIGIKLDVLPKYHLDDSIFVDLNIEVSSLGENLGTVAQPAYAIGTRNVHTTMILGEGETAVLGGLITETEQKSLNGVPALSEAPLLERLFTTRGNTLARTELLLTVTPRVLRAQSLPGRANTDFYSGTGQDYSTRSGYDYLKATVPSGNQPIYSLNPAGKKDREKTGTSSTPEENGK